MMIVVIEEVEEGLLLAQSPVGISRLKQDSGELAQLGIELWVTVVLVVDLSLRP